MRIHAICGSFRRRVWHPAIPTPPAANPPTEFTEFTEVSGVGYSPTDFTDLHRFLGCVFAPNLCTSVQSVGAFVGGYGILPYPRHPLKSSHRIHRIHRSFWCRISSHRIHRIHGSFWCRIFSHGIHRIHGSFWCRIFSHGIHRMLGCVIGGVGMAGMPYPPNLCASVPICGRLSLPEGSVCSAYSVGNLYTALLVQLCWCT